MGFFFSFPNLALCHPKQYFQCDFQCYVKPYSGKSFQTSIFFHFFSLKIENEFTSKGFFFVKPNNVILTLQIPNDCQVIHVMKVRMDASADMGF